MANGDRKNGAPREPQVPLWVFLVTTLLCWGGFAAILVVLLVRDSQNVVLAGIALWLLTTPIIGFRGASKEVRRALIRMLGGNGT